ncbi:MAG TPA: hypothetical protein PLO23_08195 [Alphaproteobacteria bacterium]|nr:hypothetical protein [Alphaproteobacteria bacterium]
MRLLASILALCFVLPLPAMAEDSYMHSVSSLPSLEKTDDPDFWKYYDYHARRFEYAQAQKEFREKLDERRENYVRYRQEAIDKYNRDLRRHYARID